MNRAFRCLAVAALAALLPVGAQAVQGMDPADFTLPAALTELGVGAFEGMNAAVVELPARLTAIPARAFANCKNLRQIHIPASVTSIAGDAFTGCSSALTIFGEKDTAAKTFAKQKGFAFVDIKTGVSTNDEGDIIMPPAPL